MGRKLNNRLGKGVKIEVSVSGGTLKLWEDSWYILGCGKIENGSKIGISGKNVGA